MQALSKNTTKLLKICSEPKLQILRLLITCQDELCGCDIVDDLSMPKNLLSHHLKELREINVVEEEKCGRRKKYRLTESSRQVVFDLLKILSVI